MGYRLSGAVPMPPWVPHIRSLVEQARKRNPIAVSLHAGEAADLLRAAQEREKAKQGGGGEENPMISYYGVQINSLEYIKENPRKLLGAIRYFRALTKD